MRILTMNKLFGKSKITCKTVEKLIVKKDIVDLKREELHILEKHIEMCESCRQYAQTVIGLQKEMQLNRVDEILADPQTENYILEKFENENSPEPKIIKKLSQVFWDMFNVRIPLYKAIAGGLAVILLLFVLIYTPSYEKIVVLQNNQSIIALIDTNDIHFNTVKNLRMLENQKKGRSLVEDSVLARLSHYSM